MKLNTLSPIRPSLVWRSLGLQSMDKATDNCAAPTQLTMSTYVLSGRRNE